MGQDRSKPRNLHHIISDNILWRWAKRIGVEDLLADGYWQVRLAIEGYNYTQTVNDISATLEVESSGEWSRIHHLAGERDILERFISEIKPDDIVFDIGANIGVYSCFALQKLVESGNLYAFEANPPTAERLTENLSLNGPRANYDVIQVALSDSSGNVKFHVDGEAESGTHSISYNESQDTITVPQSRGDEFVLDRGCPIPNVIKIDVEGAEYHVLKGFSDVLSDVRVVICEIHPDQLHHFGTSDRDVEQKLREAGFSLETLSPDRDGNDYHILAS